MTIQELAICSPDPGKCVNWGNRLILVCTCEAKSPSSSPTTNEEITPTRINDLHRVGQLIQNYWKVIAYIIILWGDHSHQDQRSEHFYPILHNWLIDQLIQHDWFNLFFNEEIKTRINYIIQSIIISNITCYIGR